MKYHRTEMKIVRRDNGKSLYLTKYECDNSKMAHNILMIHGLTYAQFVFDMKYKDYSMCEYFAEKGYNVWRLDLGGYGKSEQYKNGWDVTTENATEDVLVAIEKICELQKVKAVDVLGWSWGTMIAARASIRKTEQIRKMIWLGPCFGGMFEPVEINEPFLSLDDEYINRIWQKNTNLAEQEINLNTVEPGLQNMWMVFAYTQKGGNLRPGGGAKEIMEAGDKWLIEPEKIERPVLMIAGDNDFYVNIKRCYQAERLLPEKSHFLHLPEAGHAMYLEKEHYKKTREAIWEFLNE